MCEIILCWLLYHALLSGGMNNDVALFFAFALCLAWPRLFHERVRRRRVRVRPPDDDDGAVVVVV